MTERAWPPASGETGWLRFREVYGRFEESAYAVRGAGRLIIRVMLAFDALRLTHPGIDERPHNHEARLRPGWDWTWSALDELVRAARVMLTMEGPLGSIVDRWGSRYSVTPSRWPPRRFGIGDQTLPALSAQCYWTDRVCLSIAHELYYRNRSGRARLFVAVDHVILHLSKERPAVGNGWHVAL